MKYHISEALGDTEVCFLSVNDKTGNFTIGLSNISNKEKAENRLKEVSKLAEANYEVHAQDKVLPKITVTGIPLDTLKEIQPNPLNSSDSNPIPLQKKKFARQHLDEK